MHPLAGDRSSLAGLLRLAFDPDQSALRPLMLGASACLGLLVATVTAMGYRNVMWGSDYPHVEGTFGHTQETLQELFEGVSDDVRHRITVGAFLDLFPEVGEPPATRAA